MNPKMILVQRANEGNKQAKKALQLLIDRVLGKKIDRLLQHTEEKDVDHIIDLLARVQDIREHAKKNKHLQRAVDYVVYLYAEPGKEKVMRNIVERLEEVADRMHIAGQNPPVMERYDIEEVLHEVKHQGVIDSARELLQVAKTLRDKHGVKLVEDPRIMVDGEPVKIYDINDIINTLRKNPSAGYVSFAHDVITFAAMKHGIDTITDQLLHTTVHGQIIKMRKFVLTKKNERFIKAKRASADCTSPNGAAFDSFTIPALVSNSIGNLEIHADVVEHDPKRKGKYKVARNKHIGNVSFMVGKTRDGRDIMYIHHIEFSHPYRLVSNAEKLSAKIIRWLSDYARENRFDILAFDPEQISNHGFFAKKLYEHLEKIGAGEINAEKIIPLDHVTGERTTPLEHYGAPWIIEKRGEKHPIALEI